MTVAPVTLSHARDDRGLLVAGEWPAQLPFVPVRVFVVLQSPAGTVRGGHAHRECHQVLAVVVGRVLVEWEDEQGWQSRMLADPAEGLHIPPLVWARQTYLDPGSSLLVLASHIYDPSDYVDDIDEARRLRSQNGT